MAKTVLTDAFAHHVWATLQVMDVCRGLTTEQLETTVPGTYGSILDTLRHLVGADASYLHVLGGGRRPEIEEEQMDLAALRAVMVENGPMWAALVEQDADPDEPVVRHRPDGSQSSAPRSIRLAQVIHHGTDHRSQVCTALTSIGITPPEIDVWDYAWQDGRLTETPAPAS